jgi:hypothetical protein
MKINKGAVLASMAIIVVASVFAGAGTMAYFFGYTDGSGAFTTGTLSLGTVAYSGWTVGNLKPGDGWDTTIQLRNTGTVDAMYVYAAFYITENGALADKIVLTGVDDWCYLIGWSYITFDEATANDWLKYWGAPPWAQDGSISLLDLATWAMSGGDSAKTSLKFHTGNPPTSGPYLPAGKDCIIKFHFKLLETTGNEFQGQTCSFTIRFIASDATGTALDNSLPWS